MRYLTSRVYIADIRDIRPPADIIRDLIREGYTLRIGSSPVGASEALEQWRDAWVEAPQPVSEWAVPICPECDLEILMDESFTQSAHGPLVHARHV